MSVPRDTAIVWSKMVNYRYAQSTNCGGCAHRGSYRDGSGRMFGCALHSFIPFTTSNNVCDHWEKPEPQNHIAIG